MRQLRAVVVAFRGMVVDDVEDDLDVRLVERAHHRLNSATAPVAAGTLAYSGCGAK